MLDAGCVRLRLICQWQPLVEDRAFMPWLVKVRAVPCRAQLRASSPLRSCRQAQSCWRRLLIAAAAASPHRPTLATAIRPAAAQHPSEHEVLRARHLSLHQVVKLEELWRANPTATGAAPA